MHDSTWIFSFYLIIIIFFFFMVWGIGGVSPQLEDRGRMRPKTSEWLLELLGIQCTQCHSAHPLKCVL